MVICIEECGWLAESSVIYDGHNIGRGLVGQRHVFTHFAQGSGPQRSIQDFYLFTPTGEAVGRELTGVSIWNHPPSSRQPPVQQLAPAFISSASQKCKAWGEQGMESLTVLLYTD